MTNKNSTELATYWNSFVHHSIEFISKHEDKLLNVVGFLVACKYAKENGGSVEVHNQYFDFSLGRSTE